MPPPFRLARTALIAAGVLAAGWAAPTELPLALRGVNPDLLSGGLFTALDGQGAFGFHPPPARVRAGTGDLSKGRPPAVLDARVGANLRLSDDPAALSETQRGQAEPHLYRSAANPDVLLATFQEGRFGDLVGGALDCGYSVSRDGGLTWTRALIPQLTLSSGGPYFRATDPVAAIGPLGDLYLNALGAIDSAFDRSAVLVSRSTDNGVSWTAPVVVFQSPNGQTMADKNWLTVNDLPGAANPGRLVATWTNFTSNAAGAALGNNIVAAVSDDRGSTWTAPIAVTSAGSSNQGSQPVFLPDGSLVLVYVTFNNPNNIVQFSIQCKRSTDGGRTYPANATTVVGFVAGWDDPDLRDGVFLPAAAVARQSGELFVCYTAVVNASPRVLVTKSSDQGATWSAPIVVSDQPVGVSVMNPGLTVTPDGRVVSVVFMDKRNASDGHNFVDHYAAQSFDGGATWQPNIRLTEMTSDIRFSTATSRGYMLGDYLGVAPALAADQPCVAIWCDTRTGDADPFTVRFTPSATQTFDAWRIARFTREELADSARSGAAADFDSDGVENLVEFDSATDPRVVESGESLVVSRPAADKLDVATLARSGVPGLGTNFGAREVPLTPPDLSQPQPVPPVIFTPVNGVAQIPSVTPRAGLVWRAVQFPGATGKAMAVGRGSQYVIPAALPPGSTTAQPAQEILFGGSRESPTNGTNARLINLSTRGQIKSGASQLIAGFVTRGGDLSLLLRGVGPSLAAFGVPNFAADPSLAFFAGTLPADRFSNNDWGSSITPGPGVLRETAARVGAFPLIEGSKDAASTTAGLLGAGSFTVQVSNLATAGGTTGLVEVYNDSANASGELINLSTRSDVGTGENALIAGLVIGGTQPRRVLLRAVGPSLAAFALTGLLADPVLTLFRDSAPIATNDDWEISRSAGAIAATAQRVGAFPLQPESRDAALLITLLPGNYTVAVTGAGGTMGLALVEIYDAD